VKYFIGFIVFFVSHLTKSQLVCDFQIMNDTVICGPSEVLLWQKGIHLGKSKWLGSNFTSSDTLPITSAYIDQTMTFYATNRVLDPINLIENGNFENGNEGFTSMYDLSCINAMMPPGSYCINNKTNIYWPLWNSCIDHTYKDGTGLMYVTDGAPVINEHIWCQSIDVESNTDYAFSTWITSVISTEPAILQFTINNKEIGSSFTASENECEWNEFFEIWNSGLNTSAEICITNENTAVNGNDFAMDDISFQKVCYHIDSVTIEVIDTFDFNLNQDTSICPGDIILLKPDTVFNNDFNYRWDTGESTSQISISDIGIHTLTITHNVSGCAKSKSVNISSIDTPVSQLINDTTVCLSINNGVELYAGEAKWIKWTHPNGTDSSKTFIATEPGYYEVILSNGENCAITDRITVENFCATDLFVPNSFTPNGDFINDTFGAKATATYYYHLQIFNRMGKIIFETYDLNQKWTGENSPEGAYVFWIDYHQASRETGKLEEKNKVGTVLLIR
tara:strand:+ start:2422 stop:3942 length:1521 start_codon:yes stop_codon:yes gene_type:complete